MIVASVIALIVFMAIMLLMPLKDQVLVTVKLPEKMRTIVLPEPEPEPPPPPRVKAPELEPLTMQDVSPTAPEDPEPEKVLPREAPKLDPNLGTEGRKRAREATAELTKATSALDQALGDLTSSLRSSAGGEPTRRRTRGVRSGRSDGELAAYDAGTASSGAATDLKAVEGSLVSVGSLTSSTPTGDTPASSGATKSGSAGPGVYRTNASLLAVIQKYAAGIQYCYTNELKRDPTLKGKLVVSITVSSSGKVTNATVIQNTVRSEKLAGCALSQILNWRFPPIEGGDTAFQTPFVFTPPE
jgi:TonB family protein